MAPRRMIEILRLMSMFFVMAQSQSQSDESSYCITVLISLSPCLDYITGKATTPSSSCCSQLAFVVKSQPECLCELVSGCTSCVAASLNINQTLALSLPSACNVQTPPISSSCTGSASSPTGVSVSNIPNSPSGIGSNSVWSTTGGSRSVGGSYYGNSSPTKIPSALLILFLFATFTFMTTT